MAHSTHLEVERKYDVEADRPLPNLLGTGSVAAVGAVREQSLEAEYFDTGALDLARLRMSLRRRVGGRDAGWHLKVPAGGADRLEVHFPLGPVGGPIPEELGALVRGAARDQPLVPVARVVSLRAERSLLDEAGNALATLCDDRVTAERHSPGAGIQRWREWEVELAEGDERVLDDLDRALLAAGGEPAAAKSKIRRALGLNGRRATTGGVLDDGTAGSALAAYLATQRDRLLVHDVGVRLGSPVSVHHLRTTTRRLRSALATYRSLLADPSTAEELRAELKWLGEVLATARDAEVLREHLDEVLRLQEPELVIGPIQTRIDDELAADYRLGVESASEALGTPRYFALLAALDLLVESPAYTPVAQQQAESVLPQLLARETKRLRRTHRAVPPDSGDPQRDARLHEVRKKAKRLRYAADAAKPSLGAPARRLARRARRVQESLGERQDAVVARARLRELGLEAQRSGESGFTFGRLHALEGQRIRDAEEAFRAAWRRIPR
jgi:CHAD domain-containing protein